MPTPSAADVESLQAAKVFISYAREDTTFARRLYDELKRRGFPPWADWAGIPPADDWLRKIHAAIESVDAFVFVISPTSLASEVCAGEVQHAVGHNKRVIPLVLREERRTGEPEVTIPESLRRLNWIFFRETDDFDAGIAKTVEAIATDLPWVEEHTRLLGRAIEWKRNDRDPSFLLQRNDLLNAEHWLTRGPDKDPKPTALQSDYIIGSRAAATQRQRRLTAAALGAVVAIAVVAVIATVQYFVAEIRREGALSRQLAAQSSSTMNDSPEAGLLLAVQAHDVAPTTEASSALLGALDRVRGVRAFVPERHLTWGHAFNSDRSLVAVARCAEDTPELCPRSVVEVWRTQDVRLLATAETEHEVTRLGFSPDGKRLTVQASDFEAEAEGDPPARDYVYDVEAAFGDPALKRISLSAVKPGPLPILRGLPPDQGDDPRVARVRAAAEADPERFSGVGSAHSARVLAVIAEGSVDDPNQLELWDAAGALRRLVRQQLKMGTVEALALRDDGALGAAATCRPSASGRICASPELAIVDGTADPVSVRTVDRDEPDWVRTLAFVPGAPLVLTGGCGKHNYRSCLIGELNLWRFDENDTAVPTFNGAVEDIDVAPDGRTMLLMSQSGYFSVWSLDPARLAAGGGPASPLERARSKIDRVPLECPGGWEVRHPTLLDVRDRLGSAKELCGALATLSADWSGIHLEGDLAVAMDASRTRLAIGGCHTPKKESDECTVGRTTTWSIEAKHLAEGATFDTDGGVTSVAFSPDGKRLAVGSCPHAVALMCDTGKIELFDVEPTSAKGRVLVERLRTVSALAFDPAGAAVAYGTCARFPEVGAVRECSLGSIRAIRLDDAGRDDVALTGHDAAIVGLAFSPNGELLVSGATDGTVALWDRRRHERLGPVLTAHPLPIRALAFTSADAFTSASDDESIEWEATPARWQTAACRIANRSLSAAEYGRFVGSDAYRDPCAATGPRGPAWWRLVRSLFAGLA